MTDLPGLLLDDTHDRALVDGVGPPGWVNPTPADRYNLVVIGGGTAGLVTAAGAAGLGARVALVERRLLGGDCLNYGCVPSKALLRAARAAYDVSRAGEYGVAIDPGARVDFPAIMTRMRALRAGMARHDSARRFADLGVDVFSGEARFVGRDVVAVGHDRLRFARAVIATGARPVVPPIPGLAETGFLTNETLFALTSLPPRLLVVGAGPIGSEMAQAFARFGSAVTIVSSDPRLLPRDEPDAASVVERQLASEGVTLALGATIRSVSRSPGGKVVTFDRGAGAEEVEADEILVAVGRTPVLDGLDLAAAGVDSGNEGVTVDGFLRTSNPRVYAAGDVCSRFRFTHAADAMARVVIQNALFFGRKTATSLVVPWCTYTDPEVAHVGLTAREASEAGVALRSLHVAMADVDRAVLDGDTAGFARLHVDLRRGRILGATVVARRAGDLIAELSLAMTSGLGADALSAAIHPYPTHAEALRKLGDAYRRSRLTPGVRAALERYFRWRR